MSSHGVDRVMQELQTMKKAMKDLQQEQLSREQQQRAREQEQLEGQQVREDALVELQMTREKKLVDEQLVREQELKMELQSAKETAEKLLAEQSSVQASSIAAREAMRRNEKANYLMKHNKGGFSRQLGFLFDLNNEVEDFFLAWENLIPTLEDLLEMDDVPMEAIQVENVQVSNTALACSLTVMLDVVKMVRKERGIVEAASGSKFGASVIKFLEEGDMFSGPVAEQVAFEAKLKAAESDCVKAGLRTGKKKKGSFGRKPRFQNQAAMMTKYVKQFNSSGGGENFSGGSGQAGYGGRAGYGGQKGAGGSSGQPREVRCYRCKEVGTQGC